MGLTGTVKNVAVDPSDTAKLVLTNEADGSYLVRAAGEITEADGIKLKVNFEGASIDYEIAVTAADVADPYYIDCGYKMEPADIDIKWSGDDGISATARPAKVTAEVYAYFDNGSGTGAGWMLVNREEAEVKKKGSSDNDTYITLSNIPVYVESGTQAVAKGGDGSYVMDGITYKVVFVNHLAPEPTSYDQKIDNYELSSTAADLEGAVKLSITRSLNDPIWTAVPEREVTAKFDVELVDRKFNISWTDNKNEDSLRPATLSGGTAITSEGEKVLETSFELYYLPASKVSDTSAEPIKFTAEMTPTGSVPVPKVSSDSYSDWSITYEYLPKTINGEEVVYYVMPAPKSSTSLGLSDVDGYSNNINSAENSVRERAGFIKLGDTLPGGPGGEAESLDYTIYNPFKFEVYWHDGGNTDSKRPVLSGEDTTPSELKLKLQVENAEEVLEDYDKQPYTVEWVQSTKDPNKWECTINGIPRYDANGDLYKYYLKADIETSAAQNTYKVSYDNAPLSAEENRCWNGGDIVLTRVDTTTYSASKTWLDGNDADLRKEAISKGVTFYLWRYPVKILDGAGNVTDGSTENGAPALSPSGQQYKYKLTEADASVSPLTIDAEKLGVDAAVGLSKYDEQGYEYVYYLTEAMESDVYSVMYKDASGNAADILLNDGTAMNALPKIQIEAAKQWESGVAASFYAGSEVTLELRYWKADVDGEGNKLTTGEWVKAGELYAPGSYTDTLTLKNFSSAATKRNGNFDETDSFFEDGSLIEYRVFESSIKLANGTEITPSYDYTLHFDADTGDTVTGTYTSENVDYEAYTAETPDKDNAYTVYNRFSRNKLYKLEKVWSGDWDKVYVDVDVDGTRTPKQVGAYTDLTFDIMQTSTASSAETSYGKVTISGVAEGYKDANGTHTANPAQTLTYKVTDKDGNELYTGNVSASANGSDYSWLTDIIRLPAYDDEGRPYSYYFEEKSVAFPEGAYYLDESGNRLTPGYWRSTSYSTGTTLDPETGRETTYTEAEIGNHFTLPGDGYRRIEFRKAWLDDVDEANRPKEISLQFANVIKNDDGTIKLSGQYSQGTHSGENIISSSSDGTITLSESNNWYVEIWVDGKGFDRGWTVLEKTIGASPKLQTVEYLDQPSTAEGWAAATKLNGYADPLPPAGSDPSYTMGYVVSIEGNGSITETDPVTGDTKQVASSNLLGNNSYRIVNRKVGAEEIHVAKTWEGDANNLLGTRGDELRFYLYQNGKRVVSNGYKGALSTDITIQHYDTSKSGSEYVESPLVWTTEQSKAAWVEASGTAKWEGSFANLQRFDENGVQYEYTVKEFIYDSKTKTETEVKKDDTSSDYDSELIENESDKADPKYPLLKITDDTDTTYEKSTLVMESKYDFTNKLKDVKRSVSFYKLWHDDDNFEGRPDISLSIFRREAGSTDAPLLYADAPLPVWEQVEDGNSYYYKMIFTPLPYIEGGKVYEYFAAEQLNNPNIPYKTEYYAYYMDGESKKTDEGIAVSGASDPSAAVVNGSAGKSHYSVNANAVKVSAATDPSLPEKAADGEYIIPEGGLFRNYIEETIVPDGKKIWKNIPASFGVTDLPDVKITLIQYDPADSAIVLDDAFDVTELKDGAKSYTFKKAIPKYDMYGRLYSYSVKEQIIVDLGTGETDIEVPAYVMSSNALRYAITNTYLPLAAEDTNSRTIKVSKSWSNVGTVDPGTEPYASFVLYRTEAKPDNVSVVTVDGKKQLSPEPKDYPEDKDIPSGASETKLIDYMISHAAEYKLEKVGEQTISYDPANTDAAITASWDELQIFAPSGFPYIYFVREDTSIGMEGYTITNNTAGNSLKLNETDTVISNKGLDGTLKTTDTGYEAANVNDDASYNNDRKIGETFAKITGSKEWITATAPSDDAASGYTKEIPGEADREYVQLELKRTAASQSGSGNNAVSETLFEGTDYTVNWTIDAGTGNWEYVIAPATGKTNEFAVYAANGIPYTYTVTEKLADGSTVAKNYTPSTGSVSRSAKDAAEDSGVKTLVMDKKLVNKPKGRLRLLKVWADALNEYEIRSGSVDVTLQYRKVPASEYEVGKNTDVTWQTFGKYTLSSTEWTKSIDNLIATTANGTYIYEYRLIENSLNDLGVEVSTTDISTVPVSLASDPYYANRDAAGSKYDAAKYSDAKYPSASKRYFTKVGNYVTIHSVILNLSENSSSDLRVDNILDNVTSLKIQKKWYKVAADGNLGAELTDAGADPYKLMPSKTSFRIEYNVKKDEGSGYVYTDWEHLTKTSGSGTEDVIVELPKDGKWEYSFDNLPKEKLVEGEWLTVEYRAVELQDQVIGRFEGMSTPVAAGDDAALASGSTAYDGVYYDYSVNAEGADVTAASNYLKTRDIEVEKKWIGAADSEKGAVELGIFSSNFSTGTSSTETSLTPVKKNGANYTVVLNDENSYKAKFEGLPVYNKDHQKINYFVRELSITPAGGTKIDLTDGKDYTVANIVEGKGTAYSRTASMGEAAKVSFYNAPLRSFTVTKVWDDGNDRDGLRNVSPKFILVREDSKGALSYYSNAGADSNAGRHGKITWAADETAATVATGITTDLNKVSWFDLPVYEEGTALPYDEAKQYKYYVIEANADSIVKYTVSYGNTFDTVTGTITGASAEPAPSSALSKEGNAEGNNNTYVQNSHTPVRYSLQAMKKWIDYKNNFNKRPTELKLTLQWTTDPSNDSSWKDVEKAAFTDLDKTGVKVETTAENPFTLTSGTAAGEPAVPDYWPDQSNSANGELGDLTNKAGKAYWGDLPLHVRVETSSGSGIYVSKLVSYRVVEKAEYNPGLNTDTVYIYINSPEYTPAAAELDSIKDQSKGAQAELLVENADTGLHEYSFEKKWGDGVLNYIKEQYKITVTAVRMHLQYQDPETLKWSDLPLSYVTLNDSNSWKIDKEFKNLNDYYRYRAVEDTVYYKEDGSGTERSVAIKTVSESTDGYTVNGAGGPFIVAAVSSQDSTDDTLASGKTVKKYSNGSAVVTNTVAKTKLNIEKSWYSVTGSEAPVALNGAEPFDLMPSGTKFRAVYNAKDASSSGGYKYSEWQNLKSVSGTPEDVVLELKPSEGWKAELTELPKYRLIDSKWYEAEYRAYEIQNQNIGRIEGVSKTGITDGSDVAEAAAGKYDGVSYTNTNGTEADKTAAENYIALRNIEVRKSWIGGEADTDHGDVEFGLYSSNFDKGSDDDIEKAVLVKKAGADYTITVKKDDGYKGSFTGLPRYNAEHEEIHYFVRELSISIGGVKTAVTDGSTYMTASVTGTGTAYGVDTAAEDGTSTIGTSDESVTFYNELLRSFTVTKAWYDGNDRDGVRTVSPQFILARVDSEDRVSYYKNAGEDSDAGRHGAITWVDNEAAATKAAGSTDDLYKISWFDLPVYEHSASEAFDLAKQYKYYVIEANAGDISKYTVSYGNTFDEASGTVTDAASDPALAAKALSKEGNAAENNNTYVQNSHTPVRYSLQAMKKWIDYKNNLGKRPASLKLTLQWSIEPDVESSWQDVDGKVAAADLDKTGKKVETTADNPFTLTPGTAADATAFPDYWPDENNSANGKSGDLTNKAGKAYWGDLPLYVKVEDPANPGTYVSMPVSYRVVEKADDNPGLDTDTVYVHGNSPEYTPAPAELDSIKDQSVSAQAELLVENGDTGSGTFSFKKLWSEGALEQLKTHYGIYITGVKLHLQYQDPDTLKWSDLPSSDVRLDEAGGWKADDKFTDLNDFYKYRAVEDTIYYKEEASGETEKTITVSIDSGADGYTVTGTGGPFTVKAVSTQESEAVPDTDPVRMKYTNGQAEVTNTYIPPEPEYTGGGGGGGGGGNVTTVSGGSGGGSGGGGSGGTGKSGIISTGGPGSTTTETAPENEQPVPEIPSVSGPEPSAVSGSPSSGGSSDLDGGVKTKESLDGGKKLPKTGGYMGSLIGIGAALLMIVTGFMLVISGRRKKEDEE